MRLFHSGAVMAVCMLAIAPLAYGQASPQRIRGDIAAVHGKDLDVKTNAGQTVTVRMADNVRVSARGPADLASIAPGSFIGTTAVAQPDGTLKAVEVHVFPESMRGTGEGHRQMETEQPGSTMTNATVTSVAPAKAAPPRSTMTNATVANVAPGGSARKLTLQYKGGEKTVVVGDGVPVVMVEAGDPSMLVPGAHIVVTAAKQLDGTLTTDRISVGKNGIVPPI
jgi:hypothetical protein